MKWNFFPLRIANTYGRQNDLPYPVGRETKIFPDTMPLQHWQSFTAEYPAAEENAKDALSSSAPEQSLPSDIQRGYAALLGDFKKISKPCKPPVCFRCGQSVIFEETALRQREHHARLCPLARSVLSESSR